MYAAGLRRYELGINYSNNFFLDAPESGSTPLPRPVFGMPGDGP
jgi:hypothetical protein